MSISNQWGSGFNANVTVTAGSSAIKSWRVTWTWGGNQSIVNAWSATVTSSGTSVTANNLGYNGSVAAGGRTSFGFQASYSGTITAPTLTCSAT
jgi:cellulose 1,4-beta-cellobiosidase